MRCCVPFCNTDSRFDYFDLENNTISMHEFPKDERIKEAWIQAIGRQSEQDKLWQPGTWSVVCSRHFRNNDFKTGIERRRLLPDAIPCIFESNPQYMQKMKGRRRDIPAPNIENGTKYASSLKKGAFLAPGNAHIVRVIPVESEDNKALEQSNRSDTKSMYKEVEETNIYEEDEVINIHDDDEEIDIHEVDEEIETHEVNEEIETHEVDEEIEAHEVDGEIDIPEIVEALNIHEDKEISEDEEHDLLLQKGLVKKNPDPEFVTYIVYEANQVLPDLSHNYSGILTDNLHLKEAPNINNVTHPTSSISNIVHQVEAKIGNESQKSDLLRKIRFLESNIETFREKHKKDMKKIKTLRQSQLRNMKTIAALKKSVTELKKQNYIAETKTAILKEAPPFLVDLLTIHKIKKNKIVPKQYSSEVREFVKNLYAISPNAYKYVRHYFDMSLPHEKTILKWKNKIESGSTFNIKEDSSGFSSTSNFVEMEVVDEETDKY